jgi:CheY-like chemotaxis protein
MLPEPITVIIVEDEPETAEMIAEMVRLSGYEAIKSYGGTPAISMIIRQKPDVVLLDLMMPDLSGMDVLSLMRRDPRTKNIPVIVLSAKSRPEDIQEGISAGAVAYLTKPVAFKDLKAAVQKALS